MSFSLEKTKFLSAVAAAFGWGGFGVGISTITSNEWVTNVNIKYGLWSVCVSAIDTTCAVFPNPGKASSIA